MFRYVFTIACLVLLIALPTSLQSENWPQWRGAELNNVSNESGLPTQFDQGQNMAWRFPLPGPGGASPVVWNDLIFVTTVDDQDDIYLMCVGTDGNEKWKRQLKGKNRNSRDSAIRQAHRRVPMARTFGPTRRPDTSSVLTCRASRLVSRFAGTIR